MRAHRFRLVHFAVAQERPDLARRLRNDAAILQVAHEARLVDGVDRPEAHRHRGETPEIGHQPRVRIGRKARRVAQFVAEILQVLFGQPAFQKRARVDARRGVALEVDQVARLIAVAGVEEVIEAHFEQRGQRGVGGNVAADAGVVLVLPHHHGHGVPANQALDAALHRAVAGIGSFVFGADGVDVRRVEVDRQFGAVGARALVELFQQESGAVRPGLVDHLVQRLNPFGGFLWIQVHNPLVQFLVHDTFIIVRNARLRRGRLGTMWSGSAWND